MEDQYVSIQSNQQITSYVVQETVHQEKKNLIVPVTMIVEGVLSGSQGPLLHLAEEFGKIPESWNGIPVVINHPEMNGQSISANSPEIIDTQTVGRIYNAKMVGNKLVAEAWLIEEKLMTISNDTLMAINATKPIEVSVGVFTENEEVAGDWNGIQYTGVARNHRPDHLALLPDGVGACSLENGCGVRPSTNKKKEGDSNEMITNEIEKDPIRLKGGCLGVNAKEGLREKLDTIRALVNTLDVNTADTYVYNYLEEAYDTYLIYSQSSKDSGEKLYKQNYQLNVESDNYEFVGDPVQVERKIDYVQVNNKLNTNETMSEPCTPCIKKKVDALIANAASTYAETDREMLQTLSEEILDKMAVVAAVPPVPEIQALSREDKAALDYGKRMLAKQRADQIAHIQANTKEGVWPAERLANLDDDMLERVYNTIEVKEVFDFSLNGNGRRSMNNNASKEEDLYPTGVEIKS